MRALSRLPLIRWCRAVAALGAYLLILQISGLPLYAAEPAACCCGQRTSDQRCNCKACAHAREVAANTPVIKTCGTPGDPAVAPALEPFAPAPLATSLVLPRFPAPAPLFAVPLSMSYEVPTPPPLALD